MHLHHDSRIHHESHGNHPMGVVAFVLVLAGFASAALWLVAWGGGYVAQAVSLGVLAFACFATAITIMATLIHRTHRSPVLPDNTPNEIARYRILYRGAGPRSA